jgi:outer membrane protein assembly factor BamA
MCAQTSSPAIPPLASPRVRFEGITVLSLQEQKALVEEVLEQFSSETWQQAPESLAQTLQAAVLQAYQQKGYWKAQARAVWENSPSAELVVRAGVEGVSYMLKDVRWSGAILFPEDELRQQLAMQPGDVLQRSRILAGAAALQRFYDAHGYKNYAVMPELEFEEAPHNAILHIVVQKDGQLRFRNLAVLGLERPHAEKLERQWAQMRGQPYSPDKLRSFLQKVLHTRPGQDPLDYSASDVDLDAHSVDVRITFIPRASQAEVSAPKP